MSRVQVSPTAAAVAIADAAIADDDGGGGGEGGEFLRWRPIATDVEG